MTGAATPSDFAAAASSTPTAANPHGVHEGWPAAPSAEAEVEAERAGAEAEVRLYYNTVLQ